MLQKMLFLSVGLLFLFLYRCKDKRAESIIEQNNYLKIDVNKTHKIPLHEVYSRIEILPLENGSESAIKEVERLIAFNNSFFIYDEDQKAVLKFNSEGRFINKIQHIGRGPGEFTLLDDFEINRFTGEIELLNPRGELLKYDIEGNFKGSIKLPSSVRAYHKFCNLTDDIVIFYSEYEPKKLSYFSREQNDFFLQEYEIPDFIISKTPLISLKSSPFYYYNDNVFFTEGSSRKIYQVTTDGLKLEFVWDFGRNNLDITKMKKEGSLDYYKDYLINKDYVIGLRFSCENEKFIYVRFLYNKLWHTVIYNKTDGDYKLINKFQEGVSLPEGLSYFDDCLITIVEPSQIQLFVKPEILDESGKKILESIKLEDNPVIIKYFFN